MNNNSFSLQMLMSFLHIIRLQPMALNRADRLANASSLRPDGLDALFVGLLSVLLTHMHSVTCQCFNQPDLISLVSPFWELVKAA